MASGGLLAIKSLYCRSRLGYKSYFVRQMAYVSVVFEVVERLWKTTVVWTPLWSSYAFGRCQNYIDRHTAIWSIFFWTSHRATCSTFTSMSVLRSLTLDLFGIQPHFCAEADFATNCIGQCKANCWYSTSTVESTFHQRYKFTVDTQAGETDRYASRLDLAFLGLKMAVQHNVSTKILWTNGNFLFAFHNWSASQEAVPSFSRF